VWILIGEYSFFLYEGKSKKDRYWQFKKTPKLGEGLGVWGLDKTGRGH